MFTCNCEKCKLIKKIGNIRDSLFYHKFISPGDGPTTYYKYPDDDEKEIAYQEGTLRGFRFRYNEMSSPNDYL